MHLIEPFSCSDVWHIPESDVPLYIFFKYSDIRRNHIKALHLVTFIYTIPSTVPQLSLIVHG